MMTHVFLLSAVVSLAANNAALAWEPVDQPGLARQLGVRGRGQIGYGVGGKIRNIAAVPPWLQVVADTRKATTMLFGQFLGSRISW